MRHNYRELKICKDSLNLTKKVYILTSQLPNEEKFGLKSQINRCII